MLFMYLFTIGMCTIKKTLLFESCLPMLQFSFYRAVVIMTMLSQLQFRETDCCPQDFYSNPDSLS